MGLPNLDVLRATYLALDIEHKHDLETYGWGKKEYVAALREHYLPAAGLPYEELNSMLCFQGYKVKAAKMEDIWNDNFWMVQRKLNGVRNTLHFVKDVGTYMHTRTISMYNYRFVETSSQFLYYDHVPNFSATIDGEVTLDKPIDTVKGKSRGVVTQSSLHSVTSLLHMDPVQSRKMQVEQAAPLIFNAFDCTHFNGESMLNHYLFERLEVLNGPLQECLRSAGLLSYFAFPEVQYDNKKQFFKDVLDAGGEGVILKHKYSPYNITGGRTQDSWIKMKKGLEFDAFVTGFKRGNPGTKWENMVGALEFSVYDGDNPGKTMVIAYISGFSEDLRKEITMFDAMSGIVDMNASAYNRVAEISGQDISSRELNLSHAKIERWRHDPGSVDHKSAEECIETRSALKDMAKWVGK